MTVKDTILSSLIGLTLAFIYLVYSNFNSELSRLPGEGGKIVWTAQDTGQHSLFCLEDKEFIVLCWKSKHKIPFLCRKQSGIIMTCANLNNLGYDSAQNRYRRLILQAPQAATHANRYNEQSI